MEDIVIDNQFTLFNATKEYRRVLDELVDIADKRSGWMDKWQWLTTPDGRELNMMITYIYHEIQLVCKGAI